jgi:hypothetical protein
MIFVGRTKEGEGIALPEGVRCGHVQIVGATGRGKTESVIFPWFLQDTMQGKVSILIDGKGDREILNRVGGIHALHGMMDNLAAIDLGDLERSFVTNPLLYGSPQQITDRIFSTFVFEKEYYRALGYEATLAVVRLLEVGREVVTFRRLYELLTNDEALTDALQGVKSKMVGAERLLAQPRKDRLEKLSGLLAQLSPFADGELSRIVNGTGNEENFVSLTEVLIPKINRKRKQRRTVVILLPSLLYQESAPRLGKMFLQEIAWSVGYRETAAYREFTSVFLDEFSSFVYPGFIGLLNKARSTKVALHLSHQSLGDIEAVSPEFAKALHTNTNVKCILGVNDPDTADFYAKHFGTVETEKKTERAEKTSFGAHERTGHMSVRDVEEYKVHPNRLRHYSCGLGVIGFIMDGVPLAEEVQFARVPKHV